MKVLIIDNYDSFVYNLSQYVGSLKVKPLVYRNDEITLKEAKSLKPDKIIISPGPGTPENLRDIGISTEIIREMSPKIPTLGVCLGHQGIIHTLGGKIIRAKKPMHGKNSLIKHNGKGIFKGIPNPFLATRYHSLVGDKKSLPDCLEVTAVSKDDNEIMAIRHKSYPIFGVQFHPEAIMTRDGMKIIKNFLGGVDGV